MKSKKIIAVLSALAVVVSSSGGLPFGGLRLFDTAVTASAADTTDYTIDMTAQGFSNAEAVNIVKDSAEIVTVTFDKGSNNGAPKYYTSGDAVRVYGGNTMTVSADSVITSIEFTFGSSDSTRTISANIGTYSEDDKKWTGDGSATSVTFTVDRGAGNRRIQALKVTVENAAPIPQTKTSLTDYDLKLGTSTLTYTGSEQTVPTTVVKKTGGVPIQEGIDYEVADNSNKATNVGNYTVKVKGIGDYDGELTADFEITQADLAGASTNIPESGFENGYIYVYSPWSTTYCYVWGDVSNNAYLGSWPGKTMDKVTDGLFRIKYPELSGSDTAVNFIFNDGSGNQSPDLKYDKSTALGNVWFVAENKSVTFQNKDTIAPAEITLTKDSYVLSGGKADAEIASVTFAGITLVKDTDYEVVGCSDNTAAGTGKITINGKGNYKGTLSKTYSITEPANDPTYTITIPATVNLKSSDPVNITATGVTLNEGQKIVVTLDRASNTTSGSEFSAKDKSGESVVKYKINNGAIGLDDANKTVAEFTEGGSAELSFAVDSTDGIKYAGEHSETLMFGIAVEDVEAESTEIDLSKLEGDYEAKDGDVLINTLAGNYKITIADGATVTLKNAVIEETDTTDNEDKWAGITANGDATIMLEGNNSVKSFDYGYPGIIVPEGKTLTIKGSGSLTTVGATAAAGIGGGLKGINCGNIVIEGGTIDATGKTYGAGIGGGFEGRCGSVTIKNTVTKVTATKGMAAKSIGNGQYGTCGTVTIGDTKGQISESPYTYEP